MGESGRAIVVALSKGSLPCIIPVPRQRQAGKFGYHVRTVHGQCSPAIGPAAAYSFRMENMSVYSCSRRLKFWPLLPALGLAALGLAAPRPATAQVPPVLTQNNDNARTGANTADVTLTPAAVKSGQFQKLFTLPLDANVNGQTLYVPGVTIERPARTTSSSPTRPTTATARRAAFGPTAQTTWTRPRRSGTRLFPTRLGSPRRRP